MPALRGRNWILAVGDGASPEVFTAIAGGRSVDVNLPATYADVTNKGSGGFQELLGDAGNKSCGLSMSGVFTDDTSHGSLLADKLAGTARNYQISGENGLLISGAFQIGDVSLAGEQEGEMTYNLALASTGPFTIVPASPQ